MYFRLLIVVFFSFSAFAQQLNFENYSVAEGLGQSQVFTIAQDTTGFIWLGTRGGGISRFDGREFTHYSTQNGLASNFIRSMVSTRDGSILIGTDEGLSILNNDKIISYQEESGLVNTTVTCILPLPNNEALIGTEDGLFLFQSDTLFRFGRKSNLPKGLIKCLYQDSKKNIWAGTEFGLLKITYASNVISFSIFTTKNGLSNNVVNDLAEDRDGTIYAATYGGGVSILKPSGIVRPLLQKNGLPTNTVHSILITRENELIAGTGSGAARFLLTDSTQELVATYTEREGLANNLVQDIFQDKTGILWFGTGGGGFSKLASQRFVRYTALSGVMGAWVFAIQEDTSGAFWFSTSEGGVTRYEKGVFKRFSQKDGLTAHSVRVLHCDRKGRIWMGTVGDGIYVYDRTKIQHLSVSNGFPSRFITSITEDTSGRIWVATAGNGIVQVQENGKFRFRVFKEKHGLPNNRVNQLASDSSGNIWAATISGLACIKPSASGWKIVRFKNIKGNVRSVTACEAGVFIGTAGQGTMLLSGNTIKWFSAHLSSLNCYSILWDKKSLWVGTEKGLDRLSFAPDFSVANSKFFGSAQGFKGIETIQNASFLDSKGNCWFGSIQGAYCYQPLSDRLVQDPPKLLLTGIQLFFDRIQTTPYGNNGTLNFGLPSSLTLPHDQNHLSFQFTAIEHTFPKGIQYRWRLYGMDNKWSPFSTRQEAVYSNLPSGTYQFQVEAISESGIKSAVLSYPIQITTPFWATTWFRVGALTVLIVTVSGIFRWRWNIREQKNRDERKKLELERSILELEQRSLRLQMNPHFLFNCLNSIKGLIAENNSEGAKIYLTRFARLMRNMLELSRKEVITLEEELQTLQLYVDLEKISSSKLYTFEIIRHDIDSNQILIPPMLLQPFVENAIWHGISDAKADSFIRVSISQEEQFLVLTIEDNGIGREAAALRSQDTVRDHKSTALTIAAERLHLLDQKLGKDTSSIQLMDLKENGVASGTKIVIRILLQVV